MENLNKFLAKLNEEIRSMPAKNYEWDPPDDPPNLKQYVIIVDDTDGQAYVGKASTAQLRAAVKGSGYELGSGGTGSYFVWFIEKEGADFYKTFNEAMEDIVQESDLNPEKVATIEKNFLGKPIYISDDIEKFTKWLHIE